MSNEQYFLKSNTNIKEVNLQSDSKTIPRLCCLCDKLYNIIYEHFPIVSHMHNIIYDYCVCDTCKLRLEEIDKDVRVSHRYSPLIIEKLKKLDEKTLKIYVKWCTSPNEQEMLCSILNLHD